MRTLGEQSVMTSGLRRMLTLPADKLASHSLVGGQGAHLFTDICSMTYYAVFVILE